MTRKIVALCLLILIPVTLNCMAASDITAAWAYAMGRGRMGNEWILGFTLASVATCAPFALVGGVACGVAAAF